MNKLTYIPLRVYLIFFILLSFLFISCGVTNNTSTNPTTEGPASVSWVGIRAVEIRLIKEEGNSLSISYIVRKANEATPTYNEAKDKVGFSTRTNAVVGTNYMYTARHYDTREELTNSINSLTADDMLSPETAYKVHVFEGETLLASLSFTTLAIPPATEWGPEGQLFVDGSLPFRDGIYQIDVETGGVLLLSLYINDQLSTGMQVIRPDTLTVSQCNTILNCAPDANYGQKVGDVYPTVAVETYTYTYWGVQQLTLRESGQWTFRDGPGSLNRLMTMNLR